MDVVAQRLDHRRSYGIAIEGVNCAELVETFAPPIDRDFVMVLVNGIEVPREWWEKVTPKEHSTVIVAIVPGKGTKKSPMLLIASIAIAIMAPYAAVALGTAMGLTVGTVGALTLTGSALAIGIGFVANMAVSALFKPSQPSSSGSGGVSASPTYALQGQSNQLDPFGPVRRVFGSHRIYPTVVGRPYIEVYGDDQYMTALYDVGAGDYDVSDVRIGASHVEYFQNADYFIHRNTKAPNLKWYWGARHVEAYNLHLEDGAWHQVDTVTDAGYIVAAFLFPEGICNVHTKNGSQDNFTVTFGLEFSDYGVGNWKPVEAADWWTASRPIMQTSYHAPLEVIGGTTLRQGGYWTDPVTGASGSAATGYNVGDTVIGVNAGSWGAGWLFNLNGTTYTITGAGAGTITISPPLQTEIVTSIVYYSGEGWGEQYLGPVTLDAYAIGAGTYQVTDRRITQLALSITIRPQATMVAGKRYSIRARQLGGVSNGKDHFGDMMLVGLTTVSAVVPAINLRNEHTLIELRVRANDQISGVLEELSCFAQSYLNVRRAGVWTYELSRNPAWALYEVLTGKMSKRPLAAAKIDAGSFEAWATYCDAVHPASGEARARFDHVVDYYTTVFALAQTITAAGRATLTPGDGLYRIIMDEPKATPVQVFTTHNSKSFQGTRTFVEAPHALRAKFMSRDTWKVEEQIVYNDGYSSANASVFENIELPGVTRAKQVWCDARYRLAQGIHRQESWTLDVDLENLVCTRGDLVHVAHDVPKLGGLPSRIKDVVYNVGGAATQWTVTEPLPFDAASAAAHGYTIRSVNGAIHQGQFAALVDPYTVTPAAPVVGVTVGDLHVAGEMAHITYPFLLAAVNPQADLAASLTLVPYAGAAIFGADTGAIPPYAPVVDQSLSQIAPLPIPKVTVLQKMVYANRRPLLSVDFDWRDYAAPTYLAYEVWVDWSLNETGMTQLLGRANAPHFEWLRDLDLSVLRAVPGTTFCVKVIAINAFGGKRTLAETPETCGVLMGDTAKPAAPPEFDLDFKRDTITLSWEHPGEPDIDFYEVRYDPKIADAAYSQSTLLAPQIGYPIRSFDVPARIGTYFIKTVDTSGNRSDEYASAYTPGANIWNLNVVAQWNDQPAGWLGNKSGFEVFGSALQSLPISPGVYPARSEYYYRDLYDGGQIYQTRFTSKINQQAIAYNSRMVFWTPLASADPIAGTVVLDTGAGGNIAELMDVWHEVRWVTVEQVMSDWVPLAIAVPIGLGDEDFGTWRRFLVGDYIGQKFQLRLVAAYIGPDAVPDVGVLIQSAHIEIDMTDRTDGRYDMACPSGGLRVDYDPAFKDRPALAITGDNSQTGDHFTLANQSRTGFNIQFFNGATPVARQFDWLAKGYGAQSAVPLVGLIRKGTRKPITFVETRRAA